MISPHVNDLKVVDTVLEPGKGVAHLLDQIEDFQVGSLVLGMAPGILFVGKM